jgi:limonene-1,2-epoxide hydrolase
MSSEWDDLARRIEAAEDGSSPDSVQRWKALFAPGGTYQDPVNPPTTDLDAIARQTQDVLPDWHVSVTRIFGSGNLVAAEWLGAGTLMGQMEIELQGYAVIELDGQGRILTWRDYFDQKEIEGQLTPG